MKHYIYLLLMMVCLISGCSKDESTTVSPSEAASSVTSKPQEEINTTKNMTPSMLDIITSLSTINNLEPLLIDDNSYYVLSSNNWYDISNTVAIINNKKEIVKTFKQAIIESNKLGKINRNEPFIIGVNDYSLNLAYEDYSTLVDTGITNCKFGLYLPLTDTFQIEPIYNRLTQYDDIFVGYLQDQIVFLDANGNTLFGPIPSNDITVTFTSDTIWLIAKTDATRVYDKNFNLLKELVSSNIYYYSYGDNYIYSEFYDEKIYDRQIYDSYGTPILSKEILLNKSDISPDILTSESEINSVYRDYELSLYQISIGDYYLLVDDNYHVVDTINTLEMPGYHFLAQNNHYKKYNYALNGDYPIQQSDGTIVLDDNGLSFSEALSDNVVSRIHNNQLTIYNYETKESNLYNLNNYTSPYVSVLTSDLFYIYETATLPSTFSVYYKGKLTFQSLNYEFSYINIDDGYYALKKIQDAYEDPSIYTLIDSTGNVRYTSPYIERLIAADKDYVLVQRGNYIGLVDYNGDFVYKILDPRLNDD